MPAHGIAHASALVLALCAVPATLARLGSSPVGWIQQADPGAGRGEEATEALLPLRTAGDKLSVCECEEADLEAHGGLQCEKEGWFVASFERYGHWINGGGQVPLSRARCCRLCAPAELDPEAARQVGDAQPVAVVSIGCHATTSEDRVSCELEPKHSLATGFQHAVLVPTLASTTFYPEGPLTCCSPVLLLSSGDAWEIERCDCEWSGSAGCGGDADNRLLWGYKVFRNGGDGTHVPVAPAQCCSACLGAHLHVMDQCRTLNHCSRRGVCVLGSCDCNEGWGGVDCSVRLQTKQWPPAWVWYLAMLFCVVLSIAFLAAARQNLVEFMQRRQQAEEEHANMLDPLIVREGDVGETDTVDGSPTHSSLTDVDEEAASDGDGGYDDPVPPVRPLGARLRPHDDPDAGRDPRATGSSPTAATTHLAAAHGDEAAAGGQEGGQRVATGGNAEEEKPEGVKGEEEPEGEEEEEEDSELAAEVAKRFDEARSPLATVKCSICYERPVQVALVPCGHSNLCRFCSRRVTQCPFCRKVVVRRQRLYLAAE